MPKLIMCRGIPGSGKSYWAAAQKDAVVVTRSDIRKEMGLPCEHGKSKEFLVENEAEWRIIKGLKEGKTVISADMNLSSKSERRLRHLAKILKADFEIKEFDTPLEICFERDSKRDDYHRVGREKIVMFRKKWRERKEEQ